VSDRGANSTARVQITIAAAKRPEVRMVMSCVVMARSSVRPASGLYIAVWTVYSPGSVHYGSAGVPPVPIAYGSAGVPPVPIAPQASTRPALLYLPLVALFTDPCI